MSSGTYLLFIPGDGTSTLSWQVPGGMFSPEAVSGSREFDSGQGDGRDEASWIAEPLEVIALRGLEGNSLLGGVNGNWVSFVYGTLGDVWVWGRK
jgi:hypothetical protein